VWFKMYAHCHHGIQRTAWPDGGSYLGQLQLTADVFDIIAQEARQYLKEQKRDG